MYMVGHSELTSDEGESGGKTQLPYLTAKLFAFDECITLFLFMA